MEVPFAPRGDHLDPGFEGVRAQFESDLIVPLARRPVGDGVGAGVAGDLDQSFGDQRTGDRRAEEVLALVDGVGPEHREHEVADELLANVVDEDGLLGDPHLECLLASRLEFFALAEVGGVGDDLAAVGVLEPLQDHRGVEAAGIGQHHFRDGAELVGGRGEASVVTRTP